MNPILDIAVFSLVIAIGAVAIALAESEEITIADASPVIEGGR